MVAQTFGEFLNHTDFQGQYNNLKNQFEQLSPGIQTEYLKQFADDLASGLQPINSSLSGSVIVNIAERMLASAAEAGSKIEVFHPVLDGDGAPSRVVLNNQKFSPNTKLEKAILNQFELKLKNSPKFTPTPAVKNTEELQYTYKPKPRPM